MYLIGNVHYSLYYIHDAYGSSSSVLLADSNISLVVEPSGVDPCVVDAIEEPVAAPADIDNPHHVDESQIESTGADVKSNETTGDSSPTKNNGGNNQNKNGKNKH